MDRHAHTMDFQEKKKGIKGLFVHNLGPISEFYFTIQHPPPPPLPQSNKRAGKGLFRPGRGGGHIPTNQDIVER